jgi:hypothetical protein
MRGRDLDGQRRRRQIPLLADPAGDPVLQASQLAMPAAVALCLRRQAPGRRLQLDHVIDELDRHPEPLCRRPVRVPLRHMVHYPLPKLYRMRLAHH